jgi:hypothetical protein
LCALCALCALWLFVCFVCFVCFVVVFSVAHVVVFSTSSLHLLLLHLLLPPQAPTTATNTEAVCV